MRIAIVAPSPIPFVMGGAERLWLGLQHHLSAVAGHDCELIKVPIREGNLLELVRAYRSFAELDLSHYDRVISTKYPAWAVSHPRHSVYMQHKLRGLYDTYHFSGQPENIPADLGAYGPIRKGLLTLVDEGPAAISGLIEVLSQLEAALSEGAPPLRSLLSGAGTRCARTGTASCPRASTAPRTSAGRRLPWLSCYQRHK